MRVSGGNRAMAELTTPQFLFAVVEIIAVNIDARGTALALAASAA